MKSEKEVKNFRDDLYKQALALKKARKAAYSSLLLVVIRMLDWIISGSDSFDGKELIKLLDQFENDAIVPENVKPPGISLNAILPALRNEPSIAAAARVLGCSRGHIYKVCGDHGLDPMEILDG